MVGLPCVSRPVQCYILDLLSSASEPSNLPLAASSQIQCAVGSRGQQLVPILCRSGEFDSTASEHTREPRARLPPRFPNSDERDQVRQPFHLFLFFFFFFSSVKAPDLTCSRNHHRAASKTSLPPRWTLGKLLPRSADPVLVGRPALTMNPRAAIPTLPPSAATVHNFNHLYPLSWRPPRLARAVLSGLARITVNTARPSGNGRAFLSLARVPPHIPHRTRLARPPPRSLGLPAPRC